MAKKKVFSIGSSLSEGLEQTFAAAHNYSNQLRIDVIPLNKIETDPENPRTLNITLSDLFGEKPLSDIKIREKESLQTLADSIDQHGILNPILVYECNSLYRLVAGERRVLASAIAGKLDIQAKIIDEKPTELKIRLLQWIENMERSDLSLQDRLLNFEMIVKAHAKENSIPFDEVKAVEISKLTGCSKPHASNLKLLLLADSEIKELIRENKIANIEKAALLSQIPVGNLRSKAIMAALKGATLVELKQYLNSKEHQSWKKIDLNELKSKKINLGSVYNLSVAKKIFNIFLEHIVDKNLKLNLSKINIDSPKKIAAALKSIVEHWEYIDE